MKSKSKKPAPKSAKILNSDQTKMGAVSPHSTPGSAEGDRELIEESLRQQETRREPRSSRSTLGTHKQAGRK
jgi:hypothetical protein